MIEERRKDIFSSDLYKVVFLSRDGHPGLGIAKNFNDNYNIYQKIKDNYDVFQIMKHKIDAILIDKVICIFHKDFFLQRVNYQELRRSFKILKDFCEENKIESITMSKVGCGMDRLKWENVRNILSKEFSDSNIYIEICSLD